MFTKGTQVVFAFSDAAGANACLAQAFIIQKENQCSVSCFSNKSMASTHWTTSVQLKHSIIESDLKQAGVLFTGTSHPTTSDHFELQAIRLAKAKKIHTIALVDHWTNIVMRFNLKGETIFPDEIWLLDDQAKTIAVQEGVPETLIRVKRNPYLVYLSSYWKSAYAEKSYAKKSGISVEKKIIVIAPDPVSLRIQDFNPGFTEITALDDLFDAITQSGIQDRMTVVIKAHPLQPMDVLRTVLDQHSALNVKLITESDNPELINIADLVIGFYSNFLLEAHAMGKPVLRYFPGEPATDPLRHLSQLTPISNRSQALLSLQAIL
jgi:hypothetical protein